MSIPSIPDWYDVALELTAPLGLPVLSKAGPGSHVMHKYIMKKPDGKGGWVYYYRKEDGSTYSSGEEPQRDVKQWAATARGALSRLKKQAGENPTPAQKERISSLEKEYERAKSAQKEGRTHIAAQREAKPPTPVVPMTVATEKKDAKKVLSAYDKSPFASPDQIRAAGKEMMGHLNDAAKRIKSDADRRGLMEELHSMQGKIEAHQSRAAQAEKDTILERRARGGEKITSHLPQKDSRVHAWREMKRGITELYDRLRAQEPPTVKKSVDQSIQKGPVMFPTYDASIRKSFRRDGEDSLSKGLYKFAAYGKTAKLPAEYLAPYLDAFIEEAYEEQAREKAHQVDVGTMGDQPTFWGRLVFLCLIDYMTKNENLAAAAKKFKVDQTFVADRIRDLNLVKPKTDYDKTRGDFMQGTMYSEDATQASISKSMSLYDQLLVGAEQERFDERHQGGHLALRKGEFIVLESDGSPFDALRKSLDARDAALGSVYAQGHRRPDPDTTEG